MQAADGPQPTACIEQKRIAISSYPPQPQPQAQAQAQAQASDSDVASDMAAAMSLVH